MELGETRVYIDPYLSDSVAKLEGEDLKRQIPIAIRPEDVSDAEWILITHVHLDHCDPHTLPKIAVASPQAKFIGPAVVLDRLEQWGVGRHRLIRATEDQWQQIAKGVSLIAVPAAHPEIQHDSKGYFVCVGYLLDLKGHRIYYAGDTSVTQEIINTVRRHGRIHTAFLPVNENNFFRTRRGIIGNMSVREAFGFAEEIGARQVVPVHWDMFAANETLPEEIRAVYRRMRPSFDLLLSPKLINLSDIRISVIIRTLNEARHLDSLLCMLAEQDTGGLGHEVILVDSGSADGTLEIAERHCCRILHIGREEFSFGRSLNRGCEAARGDILAIISGHCVPTDKHWLARLCQPLLENQADYSFGRQLGGKDSYFSEQRIFAKYFPVAPDPGQQEFFCNNANAALHFSDWDRLRFDEDLTGLEDMELAQRLIDDGGRVTYVAEAAVYHHHQETWPQIQRRFEREALALRRIMPQVQLNLFDVVRYILNSVYKDCRSAWCEGSLRRYGTDILRYRWHQYIGVYKGNNQHRRLSNAEKEKYFFPY
jgi:L-ascorbate metabolism protein UlaG (beta-lactamase superfamily)/glycosyltransferase involved in cell wall biosynthesis